MLAFLTICVSCCAVYFISAVAFKDLDVTVLSRHIVPYSHLKSEDPHHNSSLHRIYPHLLIESSVTQEESLDLTKFKQRRDILRWIDFFVKGPDQLSLWDHTTGSDPGTHKVPQNNINFSNVTDVLTVTEATVPGLYLHSNWHWTLTRRGDFDPTVYSPPTGELPAQRLPKAIIIGAGMCGTRALLEYLNLHPNIVAEAREMNFFNDEQNLVRGLTWYRASMPLSYSDQVTIEKSPAYFPSWRAPAEIFRADKTIKLILVVKDPVHRIMTQAGKLINPEHSERLYLNTKGTTPRVRKDSNTVSGGLYAQHLERWLTFFPLPQIHILEGQDLVRQPASEVHELETFLGVPHVLNHYNFMYNTSRGFFCMKPVYRPFRTRCLDSNKGVKHPRLKPWVSRMLYDFYRPHNEKFFAMIGRRFNWTLEISTL
ncbi:hypothetical protein RRG08_035290 [Elysia crispata]|uniref:Sulfotransferase domain-containing protein n=1 Tax=Elysia crispata TaxID=231223 RepID=A0AAE0YSE9_9GAST|nr:hypothetical protein RRG08_035290 [Elysia crispata]